MTESPEPTPETSSTSTLTHVRTTPLPMMTSLTTRSTHGPANRCVGCAPRTSHYAGGCTASNPIEAAASRLSALQHNETERVASELLIDGRDIWRAEADVQAYVDEQFEGIIADKVIESAKQRSVTGRIWA